MPEGDVRILGADTHISKSKFPFVLGGAALVAFLAFRRPSGNSPAAVSNTPAGGGGSDTGLEFYKLQAEAASDLAHLMAMNKLESQAQEYAFKQTPASQRMCIPLTSYYNLDKATRASFENRVKNGQLIETIGPDGICFTPTQEGQMGYMPYTTVKSKQGLFGGSTSVTGPANATAGINPTAPPPSIFTLIDSIIRAFNQPIF